MKKFTRYNKSAKADVAFIGLTGTITSIALVAKANKGSKKSLYYSFSASLEMPNDTTLKVSGQLYENLIPFLGAKPQAGDVLQFASEVADIKQGINTRWGITGNAVDDTDALLAFLDD